MTREGGTLVRPVRKGSKKTATKSQHRIEQIFTILQQSNPHPVTELHYDSDFQLLVAVMLSAQSTDKQVNKVTARLFASFPTAADLTRATLEQLQVHLQTLGLYKNKAKFLQQIALTLADKPFPKTQTALTALPGVGNKTAKVVLNAIYQQPVIAVDTHISRVAQRLELTDQKTPDAISTQLEQTIPAKYLLFAHHWLILHGRYTCTARAPRCQQCAVRQYCSWTTGDLSATW